jgi:hypothetical protein
MTAWQARSMGHAEVWITVSTPTRARLGAADDLLASEGVAGIVASIAFVVS